MKKLFARNFNLTLFLITFSYVIFYILIGQFLYKYNIYKGNLIYFFSCTIFFIIIFKYKNILIEKNILLRPRLSFKPKYRYLRYLIGFFIGFFWFFVISSISTKFLNTPFFINENKIAHFLSEYTLSFWFKNIITAYSPHNNQISLVFLISLLIVAPLYEELLFRGIFFGSLKNKNLFISFLLSAVLFMMWHSIINVSSIVILFFSGLFFNLIYYISGDIFLSAIVHGTYNFLVVFYVDLIKVIQ